MNVTPFVQAQVGASASRPASQPAPKHIHVNCRGRMRYGKYCLGRVIGPRFSRQILRCPHCSKSVEVKHLDKPWKPASYDSDLRPYFGHYRQKDRIWVCRHCSYAAYGQDFFRPYSKRKMSEALRTVRRTFSSYDHIPAHHRFVAANAAYVARGRDARFFARLFLRAMWSAREEKQAKYVASFRRVALQAMRLAIRRKLYPPALQPATFLQMADLLRQEGRWAESSYWLEQSFHALQQARKAKQKVKLGRFLERWTLQLQEHIAKRDKTVFQLDGRRRKSH